jgi:hypothetical protein
MEQLTPLSNLSILSQPSSPFPHSNYAYYAAVLRTSPITPVEHSRTSLLNDSTESPHVYLITYLTAS